MSAQNDRSDAVLGERQPADDVRPKRKTWGATPTRKPRMPARKNTRWVGEWTLGQGGSYDGQRWVRGPMWRRELLELDGHEDCCGHQWPVFVPVGQWTEDPDQFGGHDVRTCDCAECQRFRYEQAAAECVAEEGVR